MVEISVVSDQPGAGVGGRVGEHELEQGEQDCTLTCGISWACCSSLWNFSGGVALGVYKHGKGIASALRKGGLLSAESHWKYLKLCFQNLFLPFLLFSMSFSRAWCSLLESWWHYLSCTFLKQDFVMFLCIVVRIHWWEFWWELGVLDGNATLCCSFLQIASYLTVVINCFRVHLALYPGSDSSPKQTWA